MERFATKGEVMNSKISNAINKIKRSTLLLLGNDMSKYRHWQKITPTGTVKKAWKKVGKYLVDILDELQSESED
jgi:hypothetical protein